MQRHAGPTAFAKSTLARLSEVRRLASPNFIFQTMNFCFLREWTSCSCTWGTRHQNAYRCPSRLSLELTKLCALLAAAAVHQLHLGQMCSCRNLWFILVYDLCVRNPIRHGIDCRICCMFDNRPPVLLGLVLVKQGKELEIRRSSFPSVHRPSPAR